MASPNNISRLRDSYVVSPLTAQDCAGYGPQKMANQAALLAKGSTKLFGVCVDNAGRVYVSDPVNHVIYRSHHGGTVSVLAGSSGVSGNNGSSVVTLANARFNTPMGIACDAYGNVYVADLGNHQLRKITIDGKVTLIAGDPSGAYGFVNGTAAKFRGLRDIAIDASNNIYIADTGNHCIRKIVAGTNNVITIAGKGTVTGDVIGSGLVARFNRPMSIAVDDAGICFIADAANYKIKKMDKDGNVTRVVGAGTRGTTVGTNLTTQFLDMLTLTVDRSRNLYLVDSDDNTGARLMKVSYNGKCNTMYNFGDSTKDQSGILMVGLDVDRAGKFVMVESAYADVIYNYSSSSSSSSSSSIILSRSSESSSSSILLSRSSWSSNSSSSSSSVILSRSSQSLSSLSSVSDSSSSSSESR